MVKIIKAVVWFRPISTENTKPKIKIREILNT